uniref:Uncharacterized protein n=1 Tax=Oryza punctata TaxID=4537 RepID=A0A0E0KF41_ORYPU
MASPSGVVDSAVAEAEAMANHLAELRTRSAMILSHTEAARVTLDEAAGLLREEIHATDVLLARAFSVITPRDDPALAAAAKLVSRVFSDAPLLPGAIHAAMDLVASVYALPPPHTGTLQDARLILSTVSDGHNHATDLFRIYINCTPNRAIQQGDGAWLAWSARNGEAIDEAAEADMKLISAIWEARHAVRVHRVYQAQSRRREVAWEAKQILSTATEEVDTASVAIRQMRDALAAEEQIMAVPVQPVEAAAAAAEEVTVATAIAQEAEAVLVAVRDQLQVVGLIARAARATLGEAAGLLREDIHDTKILVADALAVVPALNDRDPQASLAAAAKLVAGVFSEAPVLPGAIGAAMDLVASLYAVPPPVTGPLQEVRDLLRTVSDDHDRARNLFADCSPYLGIEEEDEWWEEWTNHRSQALLNGYAAEMRLNRAIWEAGHAVRVHRFYQVGSPRRGRRMKEAWKLKEIMRTVIEEVDAVIAAIIHMRYSIGGEIQIVRNAIHAAALGLEGVLSNTRAARAALAEAAELLRDDMDATETLFAGAFATVPALDDRDPKATLAAAAKLVACAFAEAPVLPGAIGAAMDLVAGVYALPPSQPGTTHLDGGQQASGRGDPLRRLQAVPQRPTNAQLFTVEVRLQFAICEVQNAVRVHRLLRLYRHPRLLRLIRGVLMREASKLEQIVSTAIEEVDAALDAIRELRKTIATEELIVLKLIDDDAPRRPAEEDDEERKVMDLLEIAQRVADNLDDFGILLAEAAAVLQLQQQPTAAAATAEVTDPRGIAQQVAHDLAQARNRLVGVESNALAASVTLAKAAALLREDIDATKILVEDAFAVVSARDDLDPDGTLAVAAAAKLVVAVFSEVPVLPGAISAAMDLVASVCALPPPVIGTLRNAHRLLGVVGNDHDKARDRFVDCAPELGIQERGETWRKWSIQRHRAFVQEVMAETWLSTAISEAQIAVRQHRIYKENPSLSPGERARETWKVEEIVSTAINEVDAALGAVRQMRVAVAVEEQIVREAIDAAAP